jgi:hypothetical protein
MRARYYDPNTGKFLSEDPIWSTNLFAYGNNNPISYIDINGKEAIVAGLVGAIVGQANYMIDTPVNDWDITDLSSKGLWYNMAKGAASAMVTEYATIASGGNVRLGLMASSLVGAGFDATVQWLEDKGDGKNPSLQNFIDNFAMNILMNFALNGIEMGMDEALKQAYKHGGAILKPFLEHPELLKWAKDGSLKASSGAIRSIYAQAGIKITKEILLDKIEGPSLK